MDSSLFHGNLITTNRIIYTPSVFAKANLIHLQEIGQLNAQQPHTSKRENLSSYLFFVVLEGSGFLEYSGISYTLSKGDCVFLDCRKVYSHNSSADLWTLKWVHFYGPNMNSIYEKFIERGGRTCFKTHNLEAFIKILNQIHEVTTSNSFIKDMDIYSKLTYLLTLLMEESWNPKGKHHNSFKKINLQNVKDYLDKNYQSKVTLDNIAKIFYINKFYLTRIFKEQFGISINTYLVQTRITRAKYLLRFTDLSIEKIGQECGMNDANYFSRMFKKVEGISPGAFRKMW